MLLRKIREISPRRPNRHRILFSYSLPRSSRPRPVRPIRLALAGHDPGAQRFSPAHRSTRKTSPSFSAPGLSTRATPRTTPASEGAPLVIDGVLYFDAGKKRLRARSRHRPANLEIRNQRHASPRPFLLARRREHCAAPYSRRFRQSDARARREVRQALRRLWHRRLRQRRQSRRCARHLSRPDHLWRKPRADRCAPWTPTPENSSGPFTPRLSPASPATKHGSATASTPNSAPTSGAS